MDARMDAGLGQTHDDIVDVPGNPRPEGLEVIWYQGRKDRRLRMVYAPQPRDRDKPRALVLVMPGRSEFIEKYFEVIRELQDRGFACVAFDWPGQGLSQRLLKDRSLGHITRFSTYVDALKRGLEKLGPRGKAPLVMLAHSMGACIALESLRTRQVEVKAAAFSSPMWGIPILFYQRWFARIVRMFGFGAMPARGPQPPEVFSNNQLTHDETRWRLFRQLIEAEPKLGIGEPTIGWVVSALNVMHMLHESHALWHLEDVPMLVASATEETIVKRSAQRKLARRLKSAKYLDIEGAGHEVLMETDARRKKFWDAFDEMCRRARV